MARNEEMGSWSNWLAELTDQQLVAEIKTAGSVEEYVDACSGNQDPSLVWDREEGIEWCRRGLEWAAGKGMV